MLNLYKLEVFNAVIENGSFSAAAQQLYLSQPAVSQHIHDLEAALGARLFDRGARGVTPTAQGHVLYDYVRRIFGLLAEAENAVVDVEQLESGQTALAATPGISVYLLPDWIGLFRTRYPRLTVSLQTGITPQVIADVLAHRADAGFVEGELDDNPTPRLGVLDLQVVEQVVVVGPKHDWWDRDMVPLPALAEQTMIVRPPRSQSRIWLDGVLDKHGLHPHIGAEFDNLESIKRSLMAGSCVSVLPGYVVRHDVELGLLHTVAVEGAPLQRTIKLLWDKERPFSPVTRALLRQLSATLERLKTLDI